MARFWTLTDMDTFRAAQAFTSSFAEVLANVLYTQPSLRPPILRALQLLVERNVTLAASSAPPETLQVSFGIDQAAGKSNIELLKGLATNLLAVLFNVFSKAGRERSGAVLDTVSTYLSILDQKVSLNPSGKARESVAENLLETQDLAATFTKVRTLLVQGLPTLQPKGKPPTGEQPVPHAMLDLLITLVPHADISTAKELFELASSDQLLTNADATVQKKSYAILAKMCDSVSGKQVISPRLDALVQKLGSEDISVAAAAKRVRCLVKSFCFTVWACS
jgi:ribosomal RNA-processing protein 12